MFSELVFIIHSIVISCFALACLAISEYALVAFVCLQCVLANIFVLKQTVLFGFHATCADAYTVGAVIGLNLLQEYFGKTIAKKTIWINFTLLLFYMLITQIHLLYIPSAFDYTQVHFQALLQFMPRIVVASFSVYLVTQLLDYTLYGLLHRVWGRQYLAMRNYVSILACQLVDTVLFSFLGLYGIVENIGEIIVISYCIKIFAISIAVPFVSLSRSVYSYFYISKK